MSKNRGAGHYYRGDKRIDITWGKKISEGVRKHNEESKEEKICQCCGEVYVSSHNKSKWCSQTCSYKANYQDVSGVKKKAKIFGANLLMGKGKQEKLMALIEKAIGTSCIYCDTVLDLDNMSMDHIEAYGSSKDRFEKKSEAGKIMRANMDRLENLRLICRPCNGSKGDFHHNEYVALLGLDKQFPGIARKLKRRLQQAKLSWATRKGQARCR